MDFHLKVNLPAKICNKIFSSSFISYRETTSNYFESNKKLVQAFLKIRKNHAALEVFSMAIGINAIDK